MKPQSPLHERQRNQHPVELDVLHERLLGEQGRCESHVGPLTTRLVLATNQA